jgi:hypothetical protein
MTSTSNLSTFKPTYLYIKQHTLTGKLYFGKTVQDVESYLGSGTYWTNHIRKHGREHVVTLWHELFTDKDEMISFALQFSKEMKIVESEQWANLMDENGTDGTPGRLVSSETRAKVSNSLKGREFSKEHKMNLSISHEGNNLSKETKEKLSIANKGKKLSEEHKAKLLAIHIGSKRSDETKAKISVACKGRITSDEHRAKISAANTGKKRSIITCPHCGKSGGKNTMIRWHFDKCKLSN